MKYLIDVNILLQPVLEQGKADVCQELLNKLDYGELKGSMTVFHLDAAAVILMNKGVDKQDIANLYFRIYDSEGLNVEYIGISARLNALADNDHEGIDDGLMIQAMDELDVDKIITYDTDFNEKQRITPEEILKDTT